MQDKKEVWSFLKILFTIVAMNHGITLKGRNSLIKKKDNPMNSLHKNVSQYLAK